LVLHFFGCQIATLYRTTFYWDVTESHLFQSESSPIPYHKFRWFSFIVKRDSSKQIVTLDKFIKRTTVFFHLRYSFGDGNWGTQKIENMKRVRSDPFLGVTCTEFVLGLVLLSSAPCSGIVITRQRLRLQCEAHPVRREGREKGKRLFDADDSKSPPNRKSCNKITI
jgi:hypothetical protein